MGYYGYNRGVKLLKKDELGNSWGHDRLITHREYVSAYSAKHAVFALKLHGWDVSNAYPTKDYKVVASKRV